VERVKGSEGILSIYCPMRGPSWRLDADKAAGKKLSIKHSPQSSIASRKSSRGAAHPFFEIELASFLEMENIAMSTLSFLQAQRQTHVVLTLFVLKEEQNR
jgi:hypothetical protein